MQTGHLCFGVAAILFLQSSSQPGRPEATDRVSAERTLESRAAGGPAAPASLFGVSLAGYNFHREILVGSRIRVIAVSKNLGGALLVFDAEGKLRDTCKTDEILAIQLVDLDHDGIDEIVTEEVWNRATGPFNTGFVVYRVVPAPCRSVWHGEAFLDMQGPGELERRAGYLRPAFSTRAGVYATGRLLYSIHDEVSGKWSTKEITLPDPSANPPKNTPAER